MRGKASLIVAGLITVGVVAAPGVASADTGTTFVSKGDVQSALHLNNAGFDAGKFTFGETGTSVSHTRVTFTVGSQSWSYTYSVERDGSGTASAVPVLSGNGKQITGWNVTPGTITDGSVKVSYPDAGSMNPSEAFAGATNAAYAAGTTWTTQVDQWTTGTVDGLSVSDGTTHKTATIG